MLCDLEAVRGRPCWGIREIFLFLISSFSGVFGSKESRVVMSVAVGENLLDVQTSCAESLEGEFSPLLIKSWERVIEQWEDSLFLLVEAAPNSGDFGVTAWNRKFRF